MGLRRRTYRLLADLNRKTIKEGGNPTIFYGFNGPTIPGAPRLKKEKIDKYIKNGCRQYQQIKSEDNYLYNRERRGVAAPFEQRNSKIYSQKETELVSIGVQVVGQFLGRKIDGHLCGNAIDRNREKRRIQKRENYDKQLNTYNAPKYKNGMDSWEKNSQKNSYTRITDVGKEDNGCKYEDEQFSIEKLHRNIAIVIAIAVVIAPVLIITYLILRS